MLEIILFKRILKPPLFPIFQRLYIFRDSSMTNFIQIYYASLKNKGFYSHDGKDQGKQKSHPEVYRPCPKKSFTLGQRGCDNHCFGL
jgi:hypothetical protein